VRTFQCFLPMPPRPKPSSFSPTHTLHFELPTSTSSTPTLQFVDSIPDRSLRAWDSTHVLATTTTTHRSVTADTACQKTPGNFWPTTTTSHRTSSQQSSTPTKH